MTRATLNFIRGMGSTLDLLPATGESRVGAGLDLSRTDAQAIGRDWQRVAQDFRAAFTNTMKEAKDGVEQK